MKKPKPPQGNSKTALLGDLESIRTLLEEEAAAEAAASEAQAQESQDVPLLDDVVEGALRLDEAMLDRDPAFDQTATGGMDDELFQALLGEGWKKSAGLILERTRATIEEHRNDWAPQDTDELNEALKVRIDATLRRWLKRLVLAHIDELRGELLQTVAAALAEEVNRRITTDPTLRSDRLKPESFSGATRNNKPDKKA